MRTALLLSMALLAGSAGADEGVYAEFTKARQQDVKLTAMLFLSLRHPELVPPHLAQLRRNWWAFRDDVELAESELEAADAEFRRQTDQLARVMQTYRPDELYFVGLDKLGVNKCVNLYYAGITRRGPMMIRVRLEYLDGARIFGVTCLPGWDDYEAAWRAIQHPAGDRIVRVTYTPPDEREAPDDEGDEAEDTDDGERI